MMDITNNTQFNPFEDWNKFIQKLIRASPVVPDSWQMPDKVKGPGLNMLNQMWQADIYKKLLSMEPHDITLSFTEFWANNLHNILSFFNGYSLFMQQYTQLMTGETMKAWGITQEVEPVVEPKKGDKRFNSPEWRDNVVFDSIKQYYLLAATAVLKNASEMRGLDEEKQHKLIFYLNLFLDAISPSNFSFTNPEVLHETIVTGGQNLVLGVQNLRRDIKAGKIKMTDTDAFTPGRNLAVTPGQVIYRNRLIELIQYTPTTKQVNEIPLLIIPPWINRYYILDMQPQNSLIKVLVDQGFTVFIISWKNPDASLADITFEDYMTSGPLKSLEIIKAVTRSEKVNTVGYCIGGTLLSMTLPYLTAIGDNTVNSATFFVTLQDFSDVGAMRVFIDEPQITRLEGQMQEKGYLDSQGMANMFNMLRDNDLIWSNVVNNYLLGKEPPAFDLLYWNADGTRMAPLAHSFYLRNTYLENNLIQPGKIVLKGVPLDLSTIKQDVYAVGTIQDHIVPWKSAWRISQLTSGKVRFVLGGSGHIAGVINPPAKGRGYWVNDKPSINADAWFESAEANKGSWWPDWMAWLKSHSGKWIDSPAVGNENYPSLVPAPGTYILEM